MASLFSEPITYVVPNGTLQIPNRKALISKLKGQFSELEAEDFDHTEVEEVVVTQCNDTTALVEMKNLRRLRSDSSELEKLDALYICVLQDGVWRLSIAMACWLRWSNP
jgi:hypothetical protein